MSFYTHRAVPPDATGAFGYNHPYFEHLKASSCPTTYLK
jgi:hypothetical protein